MKSTARYTDAQLLSILSDERKNSVGFENDAELAKDRDRALKYIKGEMDDVKSRPGRSAVTDSAISDAIETVLPDILEIFTGGEDIVAFSPVGEEDMESAQQETEYLNHVIFQKNAAFLALYTAFKDALSVKTGVFKFWWDEYEEAKEEKFSGKTAIELELVKEIEGVEVYDIEAEGPGPDDLLYKFTTRRTMTKGCARYEAVPPEDFTVGRDTVWLPKATYCAYRTRPRVQQLIADGYDAEKVRSLPEAASSDDDTTDKARDTVGETDHSPGTDNNDLKTVEIVEHFLRIDINGDGTLEILRAVTGGDETVLLLKEERPQIEFAAITAFPNPHRFYGRSLADLLIEIQRIKTALVRMLLDSGYFALNQRVEVNETQMTANTIPDLLRNEPGVPIRSKGDAIKPIQAGGLDWDVTGALEYVAVMGEQRSGVVRNAQGLNPDTLHDTAKGAMALMGAAQRRVRMIARVFAEMGVKDLFLGIHALIRQNASTELRYPKGKRWVAVDPTQWGVREDMSIEIGVGSGGKEMELAIIGQVMALQEKIVALQGGAGGPIVTLANIHNAVTRFAERGGLKAPDNYFSNPADAPPQPPEADPEVEKAKAELQLEREKAQQEMEIKRFEAETDAQLKREEMTFEQHMAEERAKFEAFMAERKAQAEAQLKERQMQMNMSIKANLPDDRPGGNLAA